MKALHRGLLMGLRPRRSPCPGVTAWNGLFVAGAVKPGASVLLLGTGGVSLWGKCRDFRPETLGRADIISALSP
jgi:hypothetical protein